MRIAIEIEWEKAQFDNHRDPGITPDLDIEGKISGILTRGRWINIAVGDTVIL